MVSAPDKDRRILIVDPDDRFREGLPNFFGSWYDNLTRVAYYLAKNWNSPRSAQRSFESFAYTKGNLLRAYDVQFNSFTLKSMHL
jgi:hypothetical protein